MPVDDSVHVGEKELWESLVNDTDPVGVCAVPFEVSLTVAVHEEAWPTTTVEGEQATLVPVALGATVTFAVPELEAWFVSPPYFAVNVCVPDPSDEGV